MDATSEPDPGRNIRYVLTWPAWLAAKAAGAAQARTMPLAVWLREAALEKLEREDDGKR